MIVTLEIPNNIEADLLADAQESGVPLTEFVRNFFLEHYREDVDDIQIANERLNNPQKTIGARQLRKNLGLDT